MTRWADTLDYGSHLDIHNLSTFSPMRHPAHAFISFASFYKVIAAGTACTAGATYRTDIPPATPTVGTVFYFLFHGLISYQVCYRTLPIDVPYT